MTRDNTDWHFDKGKPRLDLVPVLGFIEVGKVMEYGAKKYGEHNWSKYAGRWAWTQLIASALRHIVAWMMGEDNDPESGLNHLGHANANLLMLIDLQLLKKGMDDRNPVYVDTSDAEPAGKEAVVPSDIIDEQLELNKAWTDKCDALIAKMAPRRGFGKKEFEQHWAESDQQYEPILEEDLHDWDSALGKTYFEPFHPLVKQYWDDELEKAAKRIVEGQL